MQARKLSSPPVRVNGERARVSGAIPEALLGLPGRADMEAGEARWPAWKVTVFVTVFCSVFWGGVAYAVTTIAG